MKEKIAIGFESEKASLEASKFLRGCGFSVINYFSPYPVKGMGLAHIKESRIPYIAFAGGAVGLTFAFWFQFWSGGLDYKLNLGGKPFFHWITAIPVSLVIAILGAVLAIFFGFLLRKRSLQSYFDEKLIEKSGIDFSDKFIVIIETDEGEALDYLKNVFNGSVVIKIPEGDDIK